MKKSYSFTLRLMSVLMVGLFLFATGNQCYATSFKVKTEQSSVKAATGSGNSIVKAPLFEAFAINYFDFEIQKQFETVYLYPLTRSGSYRFLDGVKHALPQRIC